MGKINKVEAIIFNKGNRLAKEPFKQLKIFLEYIFNNYWDNIIKESEDSYELFNKKWKIWKHLTFESFTGFILSILNENKPFYKVVDKKNSIYELNYEKIDIVITSYFFLPRVFYSIAKNDKDLFKENYYDIKNKYLIQQGKIVAFEKALDDKKSNERNKDREIENAQNIIKSLRSRNINKIDNYTLPSLIQKYREGKLQSQVIDDIKKYLLINSQLCLKKNGQISYNRLKNLLGVSSNKTAHNWCQLFGIK